MPVTVLERDDPDHYLELIGNVADQVSPSWDRHAVADATPSSTIAEQIRARLAAASATVAGLHQQAPDPGQSTDTGFDGEMAAATRRQSRRQDQRHGHQPNGPGLER